METFTTHLNRFYYYGGSLTTPNYILKVFWIILEEAVEAT